MPRRRPDDAVHVTISDHRIVKNVGTQANVQHERNAPGAQRYRGPVALYYPQSLNEDARRDLFLSVAEVLDQSNLQAGIERLEEAIARWEPTDSFFYLVLGNAYRAAGRDATKAYSDALNRNADDVAALIGLGEERNLRRALSLAPENTEVHKALARLLTESVRLEEAIDLLRNATRADPDAADVHNSLGVALLWAGANADAEASLREAVRFRPESPPMRVNLAMVLAHRRDLTGARYEFERAIQLGPREEIYLAYAGALAAQGDTQGGDHAIP